MALREVFARFTTAFDGRALRAGAGQVGQLTGSLNTGIGKLGELGRAFAGLAIVAIVRAWISAAVDFVDSIRGIGDELDKASQRLGVSTDALQAWRLGASHAGLQSQQLDDALRTLQRTSFTAAHGGAEMARQFRALGVDVRDTSGNLRTTEELLPALADGFAAIDSPSERGARAMAIFGDSGQRLVPLLAQGAAGLDAMREEMARLGGGATPEMVAASVDLTDQLARLDLVTLSLKSRLAVALLPIIETLARALTDVSAWFARNEAATLALTVAVWSIVGAITVMAIVLGVVLSPILLLLAFLFGVLVVVVGGFVLVIQDLYTWFTGGESVIGGFVESLLALAGISLEDVRREVRELMDTLRSAYNTIAEAVGLPTIAEGGASVDTSRAGPKAEGRAAVPPAELSPGQRLLQGLRSGSAEFRAPVSIANGAARGGDRSVRQENTINVTGSDPAAIAREVERVLDRSNREAAEALTQ